MGHSGAPEHLLCDTSFVSHLPRRETRPDAYGHWPADVLDRVRRAILAISVVTLAEARFGHLKAGWGRTKVDQDERRLASFLHIPLDTAVVDEWARMRYETERKGQGVGHNDLWIAATASVRGYPLVTCDGDQGRIDDPALEIIHLTPPR